MFSKNKIIIKLRIKLLILLVSFLYSFIPIFNLFGFMKVYSNKNCNLLIVIWYSAIFHIFIYYELSFVLIWVPVIISIYLFIDFFKYTKKEAIRRIYIDLN